MTPSCTPAVASAATVLAAAALALGLGAGTAQAAATTTPVSVVAHSAVQPRTGSTHLAVADAALTTARPVAPAVPGAQIHTLAAASAARADAAAAAADSSARSRLWHQTLAEFGILAAAFAVLARRSFRPLTARRARAAARAAQPLDPES